VKVGGLEGGDRTVDVLAGPLLDASAGGQSAPPAAMPLAARPPSFLQSPELREDAQEPSACARP